MPPKAAKHETVAKLHKVTFKNLKRIAKGSLDGVFYFACVNPTSDDPAQGMVMIVNLVVKDRQGVKTLSQGKKLKKEMATKKVARGTVSYDQEAGKIVFQLAQGTIKGAQWKNARKKLISNLGKEGEDGPVAENSKLRNIFKRARFLDEDKTANEDDEDDVDIASGDMSDQDVFGLTDEEELDLLALRKLASSKLRSPQLKQFLENTKEDEEKVASAALWNIRTEISEAQKQLDKLARKIELNNTKARQLFAAAKVSLSDTDEPLEDEDLTRILTADLSTLDEDELAFRREYEAFVGAAQSARESHTALQRKVDKAGVDLAELLSVGGDVLLDGRKLDKTFRATIEAMFKATSEADVPLALAAAKSRLGTAWDKITVTDVPTWHMKYIRQMKDWTTVWVHPDGTVYHPDSFFKQQPLYGKINTALNGPTKSIFDLTQLNSHKKRKKWSAMFRRWRTVEAEDIGDEQTLPDGRKQVRVYAAQGASVVKFKGAWYHVPEDWSRHYVFLRDDMRDNQTPKEFGLTGGADPSWDDVITSWTVYDEVRDGPILEKEYAGYSLHPKDTAAASAKTQSIQWWNEHSEDLDPELLETPPPVFSTQKRELQGGPLMGKEAQPAFWARVGFESLIRSAGRCYNSAGVAMLTLMLDKRFDGHIIEHLANSYADHHFVVVGRKNPGTLDAESQDLWQEPKASNSDHDEEREEKIDALCDGGFVLDIWAANNDRQNSGGSAPRAVMWTDFHYRAHRLVEFCVAHPDKRIKLRAEIMKWVDSKAETDGSSRATVLTDMGLAHLA